MPSSLQLVLVFYLGGAAGSAIRLHQEYATMSRERWHRFKAVGRPWKSFAIQTLLWPVFGLLTVFVLLFKVYLWVSEL